MGGGQAQCIKVCPNRSLSLRGAVWLSLAYIAFMLAIGLGFLWAGAWMVLPFAGLEAVLIGAVFYFIYRHARDHELIVCTGNALNVIKHRAGLQSQHNFQRHWATVRLQGGENDWYPSRLLLGSHGRFVEVGASLQERDRQALAKTLKASIGQAYRA